MTEQTTLWEPELGGWATLMGPEESLAGRAFGDPRGLLALNEDCASGRSAGIQCNGDDGYAVGALFIYPDGSAVGTAHFRRELERITSWFSERNQEAMEFSRNDTSQLLLEGHDPGRKQVHEEWKLYWADRQQKREEERRQGPPVEN